MKIKNIQKKIFKVAVVAVLSLGINSYFLPINSYAQEAVNFNVLQAVNELNSNSLWKWQVESDKNSELPKTLFGSLSNIYKGEPQKISHNFLYDYPEIFGLEKSYNDYAVKEIIKHKYATYIVYTQIYENIPVENSYLLISVTRNGRISLAKSKIFRQIDISTNPQLSEEAAYDIALNNAQKEAYIEEPGDAELVIFLYKNKFSLAWKIQFKTDRFGGEIKYIINDDGRILEKIHKRGHVLLRGNAEKNPLLRKKEVIKMLISLENNNLRTETEELLKILCKYEQEYNDELVSESVITADLNITSGRNIDHILGILRRYNISDYKSCVQEMQLNIAKSAKKLANKWDQYIQS